MWKLFCLLIGFLAELPLTLQSKATTEGRIFVRLKPDGFDAARRSLTVQKAESLEETWHLRPLIKVMPRSLLDVERLRKHRLLSYFALSAEDFGGKPAGEIVAELQQHPEIETVYEEPEPVSASLPGTLQQMSFDYSDCESDYGLCQKYLLAPTDARKPFAVGGVHAVKAHNLTGILGETVTVMMVETGMPDTTHEDLKPFDFVFRGAAPHSLGTHATSSAGIMVAQDNGYGVTGIVPNAKLAYARFDAGELIQLRDYLKAGDVLQIGVHYFFSNQQVFCPNSDCYLPVEDNPVVKDSLAYLTQEVGVHVVIAAANGAVNLDHPFFGGKFSRVSDSWVIYAGALDPRTGARASFSEYGSRVDLCSWGRDVTTTTSTNAYTTSFSGTSASNPIIAGCAAFVQSLARAKGLGDLAPNVLRQILVESGHAIPKANRNKNIGPQPDLVAAAKILERMAGKATRASKG